MHIVAKKCLRVLNKHWNSPVHETSFRGRYSGWGWYLSNLNKCILSYCPKAGIWVDSHCKDWKKVCGFSTDVPSAIFEHIASKTTFVCFFCSTESLINSGYIIHNVVFAKNSVVFLNSCYATTETYEMKRKFITLLQRLSVGGRVVMMSKNFVLQFLMKSEDLLQLHIGLAELVL